MSAMLPSYTPALNKEPVPALEEPPDEPPMRMPSYSSLAEIPPPLPARAASARPASAGARRPSSAPPREEFTPDRMVALNNALKATSRSRQLLQPEMKTKLAVQRQREHREACELRLQAIEQEERVKRNAQVRSLQALESQLKALSSLTTMRAEAFQELCAAACPSRAHSAWRRPRPVSPARRAPRAAGPRRRRAG